MEIAILIAKFIAGALIVPSVICIIFMVLCAFDLESGSSEVRERGKKKAIVALLLISPSTVFYSLYLGATLAGVL